MRKEAITENQRLEREEAARRLAAMVACGEVALIDGRPMPADYDADYVQELAEQLRPEKRGQQHRSGCDPVHHDIRYDGDGSVYG